MCVLYTGKKNHEGKEHLKLLIERKEDKGGGEPRRENAITKTGPL